MSMQPLLIDHECRSEDYRMSRVFCMPSKHTFTMKPVRELLERWMVNGGLWVDPFSGWNSPADITNDLNSEAPTDYHMMADEFADQFEESTIDGILFDPPYSPRQIAECYKSVGLNVGMKETQNARMYKLVKTAFMPKLTTGCIAISFGWNSMGWGTSMGFEKREILLVAHGGSHNDTICVVEQKVE